METNSLRAVLRAGTAGIHQRLDDAVGHFGDRVHYQAYLENTFGFRQVVEPAVSGCQSWQALSLLPDLRQDLQDIGAKTPAPAEPIPVLTDRADQIGALYVLEGSGLGARLLVRRAEALGFTEDFGARHLAHQVGDPNRWRSFIALLDTADIDPDRALAAANATFKTAFAIYAEHIRERI